MSWADRVSARGQQETLSAGIKALERAYMQERLSDSQLDALQVLSVDRAAFNKRAIGTAGLIHAGRKPWSALDPLIASADRELGSGLYNGSWALASLCSLRRRRSDHERLNRWIRAYLSAHRLCLTRGITRIASTSVRNGKPHRTVRPWDAARQPYRWPCSAFPARRQRWDRGEESVYRELALAGPFAHLASGGRLRVDPDRLHSTVAWAWRIAHRHLPSIGADLIDNVATMGQIPVKHGAVVIAISVVGITALMTSTPRQTRGPTPVVSWRRGSTLETYSPSTPDGGPGTWHGVETSWDGKSWKSVSEAGRLTGSIPADATVIVWDSKGCRIEGQDTPVDPPPAELPAPVDKIKEAGALMHAGLAELGRQGQADSKQREEHGRTVFEVLARICGTSRGDNSRAGARRGAETLAAKMRRDGW